ncbi:HIT family protein [Peredibacter sp. HCB2-198]|uniref:HIT family protein n=1 Tax=Peredibacter sp. HCB2-198 TaxID=3383025 RepID=UPI0038B41C67
MSCPLCDRSKNTAEGKYPYLIHEFKHSYLYLGEHQYYQGYCVLVTKDHYREMTDVPSPKREELFQEMMRSHEIIQKVFQPKKMNMCSLGNVVDHVHWHFFPRYESDPNFKNPPWLQMQHFDSAKVSPEKRDELIGMLKNAFSSK